MAKKELEKTNEEMKSEAEKTPEVEAPVENPASLLVPVEKPDDSEDYATKIEDARKVLFADYNKSRKISNIITVGVMVIAIGSVILLTMQNSVATLIGWILAGAAIIGMLIYYFVNRNKFPNKTRAYIKELTTELNQQTFKNEKYTNVVTNQNEKLDVSEVIGDSVYENVGSVSSRNVVRGKFKEKDLLFVEIALAKAGATKKDGPLFVGKYLSLTNNLELKGRIILTLKKEQPVDLPTKVGDLNILEEDKGFVVYGMKDCDYKKVLGAKFISTIKELAPKGQLINLNVVIWAGKCAAYVSYDDAAMALPFDKPFNKEVNDSANADVLKLFNAFDEIGK